MTQKKSFIRGYSLVVNWFISWGIMNFVGTHGMQLYRDGIAALYGYQVSTILKISSFISIAVSLLFLVFPKFLRKFGSTKVMAVGYVGCGITFILTGYAKTELLLALCIGVQMIWSAMYCTITTMMLAARWFPRKKGTVMGIMTAGGIFNTNVMFPLFSKFISGSGIINALLYMGLFIIAFGVISFFWNKDGPELCGLEPDGKALTDEEKAAMGVARTANEAADWNFRALLTNGKFWMGSMGHCLIQFALVCFAMVQVSFLATAYAGDMTKVLSLVGIGGVLVVLGSIGSGFVDSLWLGPRKTTALIGIIYTVILCVMGGWKTAPLTVVAICYLGYMLFAGTLNNLSGSHLLSVFGQNSFSNVTVLSTVIWSLKLLGTFVAGTSLSATGSYHAGVLIGGVAAFVGTVLVMLTGEKLIRPKNKVAQ